MQNKLIFLLVAVVVAAGAYWHFTRESVLGAQTDAAEAKGDDAQDENGSDQTTIDADAAAESGITVREAGSGTIRDLITLTGRITLNQNTSGNVKARFPGIVRSVSRGMGESVAAGETLATVESNDSLLVYPVKSPISGVILQRNTNVGDVASDQPLFVVADLSSVWAEFFLFPRDVIRVKTQQKVFITASDGGLTAEAPIASLLPLAEASSQTVVARATVPNPGGLWRAGMSVRGDVLIAEKNVPLAIKTAAIQRYEGSTVAFVKEGDTYKARKVELGLSDGEWTEIKSGIVPSEHYVATNSFVVKADLGKGAAGEDHGH